MAGASRILGFAIVAEARGNVGTHAQRVKILNLVAAELSMNGVLPIAQQSADNSVEHEALGTSKYLADDSFSSPGLTHLPV